MYKWMITALLFLGVRSGLAAQARPTPMPTYRNFPLILSLQFHSLAYPLKDLKANFSHLAIGLGTEIALGTGHAWAQHFEMVWYRNREAGNGLILYTQSSWRPGYFGHVYGELKAGFGFTKQFRASQAWKPVNGSWQKDGYAGKWMFTIPVGFALGYHSYSVDTYVAPYASYQLLLSSNYARGIPVMTNSLFQLGSGIHFNYSK